MLFGRVRTEGHFTNGCSPTVFRLCAPSMMSGLAPGLPLLCDARHLLRIRWPELSGQSRSGRPLFCKEVMYEEVRTIVVAGAGNQHDGLGAPHRYVLRWVASDDVPLDELDPVSDAVSAAQSVSQSVSGSLSGPGPLSRPLSEPLSESLLASLAVWLGCDVVGFRELRHYDGPRLDGDCRDFRAILGPWELQQFVQLQPEHYPRRQSVATGRLAARGCIPLSPTAFSAVVSAGDCLCAIAHDSVGIAVRMVV